MQSKVSSKINPHFKIVFEYSNDPKFSDRYAWANSADPDQTAPRGKVILFNFQGDCNECFGVPIFRKFMVFLILLWENTVVSDPMKYRAGSQTTVNSLPSTTKMSPTAGRI